MKTVNLTSACRYCRYYQPEGRRGGMCEQLGVPVQACWSACSMASPPFTSWKTLEEFVHLEQSLSLSIETNNQAKVSPTKQPVTV